MLVGFTYTFPNWLLSHIIGVFSSPH